MALYLSLEVNRNARKQTMIEEIARIKTTAEYQSRVVSGTGTQRSAKVYLWKTMRELHEKPRGLGFLPLEMDA